VKRRLGAVEESSLSEAVTRDRLVETAANCSRFSVCCSDLYNVEISDGAVITYGYKSCVKMVNKSNLQTKTPQRVTPRDSI
jgi:hypothetical protein